MARFHLEPGPIPLHHQVYLDLRAALDAGEWRTGDRLPPERDLAGRYGCSLITVRRALADLTREERLERTRGRGTFVRAPRIVRELSSTLSFSQEMELRGLQPRTTLLTARIQPAGEGVAAALLLRRGAPTVHLERLRSAADRPLLLEQAHLSAESSSRRGAAPGLGQRLLDTGSRPWRYSTRTISSFGPTAAASTDSTGSRFLLLRPSPNV